MKFLVERDIPIDVRTSIKRYLEYNFQLKKDFKIEHEDVMGLLNDHLRNTLTIYTNGKILKNIETFDCFPLEFLSHMTFLFQKKRYSTDEYVFNEGDYGR